MISWSISTGFAALVRHEKPGREFLARARILGLELEHADVERDRFVELLRRSVEVGDIFQDRDVILRGFGGALEDAFTRRRSSGFGFVSGSKRMEA
jgi:hypothetical protein